MKQIIECVPNFSEGRDQNTIKQITDEIESVEGAKLLDVDPGKATNRTVVTFVGDPESVLEAALRAVKRASQVIDMSKHKGEHPRFGATDVCPLIPVSNISMEEVVVLARKLAERIGKELGIPVYCYENAALDKKRKNLASVRSGEYEGLKEKLADPEWKPDFGPAKFIPRTGAVAVGARDFLVAYNINLNTASTRRANAIAFDVRERGRVKRKEKSLTGEVIKDENGDPVYEPGLLKAVKAIGWYIKEYGIAQISINLTNINITPIHIAFDEVCKRADARGVRVTGSELVGLVPLKAMLDAGRYFLKKQQRSVGVSDKELIKIAVKSLGLDDLYEFKPQEKIIEYMIAEQDTEKLIDLTVEDFMHETASESPAPGGGSVSAYIGALGTSLGTMVANLSAHKRGWDERWEEFSDWADKGKKYQDELLHLVDEDTIAFNRIMEAYGLPKSTSDERNERDKVILEATKQAILTPFRVMEVAYDALEVIHAMVETGNPNSVSDAGVGALAVRSAVMGSYLNVKINMQGLNDKSFKEEITGKANEIESKTIAEVDRILKVVNNKIRQL
ncbi:MAG: formiminotransferase-cyclodeaminase [Bacteroides sp. SM23_62_1]|nr:MAG: formiminotransferase-cyclodeaminase [Bacteroides sp. SM23_62_1]